MAAPRDLQSLLAWSTSQTPAATSDGTTRAAPARQMNTRLDPGLIDAILGKTDAVRMRECVETVSDMGKSLDDRMTAWDELEMILESLDNANDLQPLGLWPKIVAHLSSSEDDSIVQALWVCGTAINNNPKARDDVRDTPSSYRLLSCRTQFLRQDPLPTLISLTRSSTSNADVRSKALYCLGGLLKHNMPAIERFTELEGWTALEDSLRGAFLIGSLLVDDVSQAATTEAVLTKAAIVPALVDSLTSATAQPTGVNGDGEGYDEDVAENSLRALRALGSRLPKLDAHNIAEALESAKSDFGLTKEEKSEFLAQLSR